MPCSCLLCMLLPSICPNILPSFSSLLPHYTFHGRQGRWLWVVGIGKWGQACWFRLHCSLKGTQLLHFEKREGMLPKKQEDRHFAHTAKLLFLEEKQGEERPPQARARKGRHLSNWGRREGELPATCRTHAVCVCCLLGRRRRT